MRPSPPLALATFILILGVHGQAMSAAKLTRKATGTIEATQVVRTATESARISPGEASFINATHVYPYVQGGLYQVYAAIGRITDLALEPGERLTGSGPVAAGDTARWMIADTTSGAGEALQTHILIKPIAPNLTTNLIINTDKRTYHIELSSFTHTFMPGVSWRYPKDALLAGISAAPPRAFVPDRTSSEFNPKTLNFNYRIVGKPKSWKPLRAFDDGVRVYIEMPASVREGDLPPLFLTTPTGGLELTNYRMDDRYLVVDRLFNAAELRLGSGDKNRIQILKAEVSHAHAR